MVSVVVVPGEGLFHNSHELYVYADTYDMYVYQTTQPIPH